MDQSTLDRLHNTMVEILDEFVRVCEENCFTYFFVGGTLLGAVRHKGFIPWDDDIDVSMPRNDYEKFLDIYKKNNETNYYVLSYKNTEVAHWRYKPYAKLCKKNTIYATNWIHNPEYYPGIFIDIFPIDNCIKSFSPLQMYFISLSWKLFYRRTQVYNPKKLIKRLLLNIIFYFFSIKISTNLVMFSYSLFNKFKTKYVCCFPGFYGYEKETHKKNTIYPLTKVFFEGKYYWAPGNWDAFLKQIYGNYMELPPIEKRITHDITFISFGKD